MERRIINAPERVLKPKVVDRQFLERYDHNSGTGEIRHIEQFVLNKLFSTVSEPITQKDLQIKGVDYICGDGVKKYNVDVKHDHATSIGDFLYELHDRWGYSWTQPGFHITDYIAWIKHSEGCCYLIDYKKLVELPFTELFKHRHTYNMGEGAVGKFFRLFDEVPVEKVVMFERDLTVPMRKAMSDFKKYLNDE